MYRHAIAEQSLHPEPVFILGHPRTGFPSSFLCIERFRWLLSPLLSETRPMDNMKLTWEAAEEGDAKGAKAGNRQLQQDFESWRYWFMWFMRKVTFRHTMGAGLKPGSSAPKPLLIKSPVHTARMGLFRAIFPQARFLYIHRHPVQVFKSAAHMADTYYWYTYLQRPDNELTTEFIFSQYELLYDSWSDRFEGMKPKFEEYFKSLGDFKKNDLKVLSPELESKCFQEKCREPPSSELQQQEDLPQQLEDIAPHVKEDVHAENEAHAPAQPRSREAHAVNALFRLETAEEASGRVEEAYSKLSSCLAFAERGPSQHNPSLPLILKSMALNLHRRGVEHSTQVAMLSRAISMLEQDSHCEQLSPLPPPPEHFGPGNLGQWIDQPVIQNEKLIQLHGLDRAYKLADASNDVGQLEHGDEELLGLNSLDRTCELADCLHIQALCVANGLGQLDEAIPLFRRSLKLRIQHLGHTHWDTASTMHNMGVCLFTLGQVEEAESLLQQALSTWTELEGRGSSNVPQDIPQDPQDISQDTPRIRQDPQEKSLQVVTATNSLAVCLYAQDRFRRAEPLFRAVLAARMKQHALYGGTHPEVVSAMTALAVCLGSMENFREAEDLHRQAVEYGVCEKYPPAAAYTQLLSSSNSSSTTTSTTISFNLQSQPGITPALPTGRRIRGLREASPCSCLYPASEQ
eukprot:gene14638-20674_t